MDNYPAGFPVVNWGRGRLLPFESNLSFLAKFCLLNHIEYNVCFDFFKTLSLARYLDGGYLESEDEKTMSKLLHEDISVVSTLNANLFYLQPCFGTFSYDHEFAYDGKYRGRDRNLFYCEKCMSGFYHASFHSQFWLDYCPIHQSRLTSASMYELRNYSVSSKPMRFIQKYHEKNTYKFTSTFNRHRIELALSNSIVPKLIKWISDVSDYYVSMKSHNIMSMFGDGYKGRDIKSLLGRINWAVPMPDDMRRSLNIEEVIPKTVACNIIAVKEFISLSEDVGPYGLLEFYLDTLILRHSEEELLFFAKENIDEFESKYSKIPNCYGILNDQFLVKVDCEGWPYFNIQTPLEYLANKLKQRWVFFHDPKKRYRANDVRYDQYMETFRRLHNKGYVSVVGENIYGPHNIAMTVKINARKEVIDLMEMITRENILITVKNSERLMDSFVCSGARISMRDNTPSVGNLFFEPNRAYLLIWPY